MTSPAALFTYVTLAVIALLLYYVISDNMPQLANAIVANELVAKFAVLILTLFVAGSVGLAQSYIPRPIAVAN